MSTYGDRGNIITLQKRCEWRDIEVEILKITLDTKAEILNTCDLIFMGGAQDTQQEIVNHDLIKNKGKILIKKIEEKTPGLFICGAYQFLGKYYKTSEGKKIPGLGLFPLHTDNPGENTPRLIGNVVAETSFNSNSESTKLVGFENHGGRTYLEDSSSAFAKVLKGSGNNGKDRTEGIKYKNTIGSYFHGPILPKNVEIADWLIRKSLKIKYKEEVNLADLNDDLEKKAKKVILSRLLT